MCHSSYAHLPEISYLMILNVTISEIVPINVDSLLINTIYNIFQKTICDGRTSSILQIR